jgi:CubicO group peptidase (beta-lactamase class C family)
MHQPGTTWEYSYSTDVLGRVIEVVEDTSLLAAMRERVLGPLGMVGELNWGGAGGTYFWIDPREDLFVVYMMQSPKQRVPYRSVLKDMVYAAITRPAAK